MDNWLKEFHGAVTVIDKRGKIIYMNDKAAKTFEKDGGAALVGCNVMECHPLESRRKIAAMLIEKNKNVYTIEKNGIKKIIHQSPWYENNEFAGIVELSLEIPFEMPHFIRQ